jgi:hypothetical protein
MSIFPMDAPIQEIKKRMNFRRGKAARAIGQSAMPATLELTLDIRGTRIVEVFRPASISSWSCIPHRAALAGEASVVPMLQ